MIWPSGNRGLYIIHRGKQMLFSLYFVYFIEASFAGWVWECTYNAVKQHRWENRGFLFGPVIPIYGVGTVGMMIIVRLLPSLSADDVSLWKVFLISVVGSAILEYLTSYVMEKLFHAVWWDYSDMPLNIHGRICLPASLAFGVAGVFIVKYVIPFAASRTGSHDLLVTEGLSLLLMCAFGADLGLSVASIQSVAAKVQQLAQSLNEQMKRAVEKASVVGAGIGETGAAGAAELRERLLDSALGRALAESSPAQRLALLRVRRTSFTGDLKETGERYLAKVKKYSPRQLMHRIMEREEENGEQQ